MQLRVAARNHSPWTTIVLGGVVAGTLDIGAAALINWASPALILRFVAGGLLGKTAQDGGAAIALLGYGVQIAMSLIIAAIYVGASGRLAWLRERWIAAGLAFGVVVFLVMNFVVMPLSALARWPHFTVTSFAWNMLAMLVFGVIIAFFARDTTATRN